MTLNNILLLSCRSPYLDSDKCYPPLANLYLHTAIQQYRPNTKVTVTDDYNLQDPTWLEQYDGIGISIMTPQRAEAKRILDFIKKHKPNTTVFCGGPHVKHYKESISQEPWDYIIPQDGIRAIQHVIEQRPGRIIDDFIKPSDYATQWVKPNRLQNARFLEEFTYQLGGKKSTTMLTAQGCPMACTFCEDARTSARWTPLPLIIEELDDIKSLGYEGIYLFDDLFAIAMPKVKPITEEIKKRGFTYRCNGQANFFTKWGEDFAKLLADSGCVEIAFGHETGSQKILDNVLKQTSVEQNYKSVEYAKKHGIKVKSFLMLGLPGEDLETIAATEKFIATSGADDFQLSIYYPYSGTQIRDSINKGDKSNDLVFIGEGLGAYGQKGGSTECVVRTKALTAEEILAERDRLVKTYRPQSHRNAWVDSLKNDHFFDVAHKSSERFE